MEPRKPIPFHFQEFLFSIGLVQANMYPVFLEAVFRGGLGHTLKATLCKRASTDCTRCNHIHECIYIYLFEPRYSNEEQHQGMFAPRPYTIYVNQYNQSTKLLQFQLVMIGKSIVYFPYFLHVFQTLGRLGISKHKVKFTVEHVQTTQPNRLVFQKGKELLPAYNSPISIPISCTLDANPEVRNYHIILNTPLRLQQRGEMLDQLDWMIFVKAILRKVSQLSELYGQGTPDWKYSKMLEPMQAVKLEDANLHWDNSRKRYSQRQQKHLNLSGLIGSFNAVGVPVYFDNLLTLGSYIHIGKNTSFGLGKYSVLPIT